MSDIGYLKLFRQIQNNYLWKDKPFAKGQAWVDLLILAYYDEYKTLIRNKVEVFGKGQFHTSIGFLADRWGWNRKTVMRFLDLLESDGMLTQSRTADGTTLTIVKYEDFQNSGTPKGTTKGTAEGTSMGQPKGQLRDTQRDTQRDTIKEIKNIEEVKEVKETKEVKKVYGTFENVQLTDTEYQKLQDRFPDDYEERINSLSEYMGSKGKSYKSHYATILSWDRLDKQREEERQKPKTSAYMEAIKNRIDIVDSWVNGGSE